MYNFSGGAKNLCKDLKKSKKDIVVVVVVILPFPHNSHLVSVSATPCISLQFRYYRCEFYLLWLTLGDKIKDFILISLLLDHLSICYGFTVTNICYPILLNYLDIVENLHYRATIIDI